MDINLEDPSTGTRKKTKSILSYPFTVSLAECVDLGTRKRQNPNKSDNPRALHLDGVHASFKIDSSDPITTKAPEENRKRME